MTEAPEAETMTTATERETPKKIPGILRSPTWLACTAILAIAGALITEGVLEPAPDLAVTDRGIELQRPQEPPFWKRTGWTLMLLFRLGPNESINPLWGYEADGTAERLLAQNSVQPTEVEPAAVIQPCTPSASENRWCALYAPTLAEAAERATELAAAGETALVGTTYRLPAGTPRETFLSWHTPTRRPRLD